MKLYERLSREGGWWDLVDDVAEYLVGAATLAYRSEVRSILERWIDDSDLCIRRTAIIAQFRHKGPPTAHSCSATAYAAVAKANFSFAKPLAGRYAPTAKATPKRCAVFYWKIRTLAPVSCVREPSISTSG
jgi:hypothetical protein